jgi:hypothetical protein
VSLARQIERAKAMAAKPEPKAARLATATSAMVSAPKGSSEGPDKGHRLHQEDCVNPSCPYRQEILKLRKRKAESQAKWRKAIKPSRPAPF